MNRFTFSTMNYKVDIALDALLTLALNSGIKSIKSYDTYHITIAFNDGSIMNAWNVNKYHAWLNSGSFKFPNKEDGEYCWHNGRPKIATMARLCKILGTISYSS